MRNGNQTKAAASQRAREGDTGEEDENIVERMKRRDRSGKEKRR